MWKEQIFLTYIFIYYMDDYIFIIIMFNEFEDSARDLIKIKYDAKNNGDDGHEAIDKLYDGKYSCLLCQLLCRLNSELVFYIL